jgi:fatty acid synthase
VSVEASAIPSAGELLTGEWAIRYGSIPLPVDGVLLGTVAMACAEATATTA